MFTTGDFIVCESYLAATFSISLVVLKTKLEPIFYSKPTLAATILRVDLPNNLGRHFELSHRVWITNVGFVLHLNWVVTQIGVHLRISNYSQKPLYGDGGWKYEVILVKPTSRVLKRLFIVQLVQVYTILQIKGN